MSNTVYYEDLANMVMLPPLHKPTIERTQLVRYAGASGDFNPLHYDDEAGKAAGTGGVIAHGMLIMGFTAQAVTRWIPNRCLKRLSVRFVNITRPGEQITVGGRIIEKRVENGRGIITGEVWAADRQGAVKLKGIFEAELPLKG